MNLAREKLESTLLENNRINTPSCPDSITLFDEKTDPAPAVLIVVPDPDPPTSKYTLILAFDGSRTPALGTLPITIGGAMNPSPPWNEEVWNW